MRYQDAEELETWLDQGLGHGGFIPEELTGALLAASNLEWTGQQRFAVVITDAPCHGKDYSSCAHDVFCDRRNGLTCTGRPEMPLRTLRDQGVKVFIFHTGEAHAVSMCEKLRESEPDLIHEKVDPSETADRLVSVLKGKLQLQPLWYLLKPLTLGEAESTSPLDLAVAHDVELEDTNGKEKHKLGPSAAIYIYVSDCSANPKHTQDFKELMRIDKNYNHRYRDIEISEILAIPMAGLQ